MNNKTLNVSIRIIALFTVAIFVSKIPALSPAFFGDHLCKGRWIVSENEFGIAKYVGCTVNYHAHNATWHWGYQHNLFFLMGLALSIVQIIDIKNIYFNKSNK